MKKTHIFNVDHLLMQSLQFYSVAGDIVMLVTAGNKGRGGGQEGMVRRDPHSYLCRRGVVG